MKIRVTAKTDTRVPWDELKDYERNTLKGGSHVLTALRASVERHGFAVPIFLWAGHRYILDGSGRCALLDELEGEGVTIPPVPVVEIRAQTKRQAKELVAAVSSQYGEITDESWAEFAGDFTWENDDDHREFLAGVNFPEIDVNFLVGADTHNAGDGSEDGRVGTPLAQRWGAPPVSILDSRQGYWRKRKSGWLGMGLRSELGRSKLSVPTGNRSHGRYEYMKSRGADLGGSIFDPVLTELIYRWFCPQGGRILDPFAGGSVRGIVAGILGYRYTGVDIREEQVAANAEQWKEVASGAVDWRPDLTPVERVDGVWVKRDDLYSVGGARGGKVRTCWALAQGASGLVTAGSRSSPQVNIVAHLARRLGIPCRVHTPSGKLSPEVAQAVELGAELVQHKGGYNTTLIKRARDDAKEAGWVEIPFGMECKEAVTQTRSQVVNLPGEASRLVVPVGSGMSLAGILWGLRDSGRNLPVLGVQVGADPTKRLDAWAPDDWREMVTLVKSGAEYSDEEHQAIGHVPLDPVYEAKCLPYLESGDCLWVVGLRSTVAGGQARGGEKQVPIWLCGDSREVVPLHLGKESYDMVFSCPPYADLEVYSDDPRDVSTMPYSEFLDAYREIINESCRRMANNRFACFVVGDVRDSKGRYRNFVSHTIQAFLDAGLHHYNEGIFITPYGTIPLRADLHFKAGRKLSKTHQNVLVFVKGDPKKAATACGDPTPHMAEVEADG